MSRSGDQGVIHKARGKESNRKIPQDVKNTILSLYTEKYHDFGPTFACEKLLELDGIRISYETLRKWLCEGKPTTKRRKRQSHRKWRERKACFGAMVQIDGSHHDWLEGRGPELVLMAYIDDATSTVFARFYDYEGTMPAMDSFKRYVKKYGFPQSVYLDRHSTYKSMRRLTLYEEREGIKDPLSQFERALGELGVTVIHAYSPQAKGRVERLFGTLQDRLVKEMRLRGVKTKAEANRFLGTYLPVFNRKYRVVASDLGNVHTKVPADFDLDSLLCIKAERTVRKDNTVSFEGKLYLIDSKCPTNKVIVEQRLNGAQHITCKGIRLVYKEITERPKALRKKEVQPRKTSIPAKDHPWRKMINHVGLPKKKIIPD